jgi:hypothetical protein
MFLDIGGNSSVTTSLDIGGNSSVTMFLDIGGYKNTHLLKL